MLATLTRPLTRAVERYLPGSLVFAVVLTFVVALMALAWTDAGPLQIVTEWGDGLTGLLAFMTQMALVLMLGHVLANTRPVRRVLDRLAAVPRSAPMAYVFVTVCAALASLLSWGLGLVVAALLSIEVARACRERGIKVHYPLLVAAGYSGFAVWHMGYSGSGPLTSATPGSFVEEQTGFIIPVTQTIFAWWNLLGIVVAIVVIAATVWAIRPRSGETIIELPEGAQLSEGGEADPAAGAGGEPTPADRVDNSRAITLVIGVVFVIYLVTYFAQNGFALTLDIVNWTFLCLILLLVGSPRELAGLVANAARNVGEILLQFPLYAGILGMMTGTGLVAVFSNFFVQIATPATLGLWAFLAGGIINIFVPSGGGQFAVQAPIFLDAAKQLGVEPGIVVMGIAYGDQWTNLIQPFWALPLLAIANLRVRDVMGYTSIVLITSGLVFGGTMLLAGLTS
ncbi:short-chain fatty acids transporter [Kineosphaera limosa]|uniref:Putative short-chain fatty acid transporter n=1 Tax=Kineosphaera limosa NBRC 100340 TaxID=1184609 RepID=K6VEU9_9MICO|nr:TIGR00366 family protein [Kineosphaera limosa]NYD99325.1 short-chain fatty acids transporter [Kineosphaera limosa]GAB94718.1 putative short-chain fatty acid transporter [Kineosphaera limosa NBRC 100340]